MEEEEALRVADEAVFVKTGTHLTDIQRAILRGSWESQPYKTIAENYHCEEQHAKNEGAAFWALLSQALGEKVGKKNFRAALERRRQAASAEYPPLPDRAAVEETSVLAQEVRRQIRDTIQNKCGTLQMLDKSQPIGVSDLYTSVNILEKIPSRRWREIPDLLQNSDPENFDRVGLGDVTEERVPGLEAVKRCSKLMVLGKPGSGKTTFLKYLAIQCNSGEFLAERVPIFITLKDFAETEDKPSLLEYITTQLFSDFDVAPDQLAALLKRAKSLILLDGLDEVKQEDDSRVFKQVRDFSDKFRENVFVITCRIAAWHYNFEKFTEVEVADFDDEQIATFAKNWFQGKEPAKAEALIQQLEENEPIRELATNPLLLTLLCRVFEDSGKLPANRSQLYEEGVDILLERWDETRKIEREQVYKNLSVQHKKKLLSLIALATFERGDYFFKQAELERHIAGYIRNLPDAQKDPEALQQDSKAVRKSIEAQHGLLVERARRIYSFSHLTFQEYFTARTIVAGSEPQALEKLAGHVTESRWREVFLLAAEMLQPADELLRLMKRQIDAIVAGDEGLQELLRWASQKAGSVQVPYKPGAVRGFYLSFESDVADHDCFTFSRFLELGYKLGLPDLDYHSVFFGDRLVVYESLGLVYSLSLEDARVVHESLDLDSELNAALAQAIHIAYLGFGSGLNLVSDLENILDGEFAPKLDIAIDPELQQALQHLKDQLPNPEDDRETRRQWWETNGQTWTEQLRDVLIVYRNIGHYRRFSPEQEELLEQYYDANHFLVDCLNSGCEVTPAVREEIEETLLSPASEITKPQM